jgi:TPR repeat protein
MFPQGSHRLQWRKLSVLGALFVLFGLGAGTCAGAGPQGQLGWSNTQRAAEHDCQNGRVSACTELGKSLTEKTRTDRDFQRGIVLLETTCGQDDLSACTALGLLYGDHPEVGSARTRARDLLTRACQRRAAEACTGLGEVVRGERWANRREATELFHTGCQLGDARGCELYALTQSVDNSISNEARVLAGLDLACRDGRRLDCHLLALAQLRDPSNRVAGAKLLAENCQHGFAMSCSHAAALFAPILSQQPQCSRALPLAEKACAANDEDGCAIAYACRPQNQRDSTSAFERLELDCERGSPLSCLYWAGAQAQRAEGAADPGRVRGAYEVACRSDFMGVGVACLRIAAADLGDAKTASEAEKVISFLREGCNRSYGEACCRLAEEYQSGRWVTADSDKVTELRTRACVLGQATCCAGKSPVEQKQP